jgi:putative NIF3 family GTP cyclohydrolase 1 type 2
MNDTIKKPGDESLYGRMEFVVTVTKALGASAFLAAPMAGMASLDEATQQPTLTVQQVINLILKEIPGAPFKETVDTLKSGSADQKVTGIVSTMFATNDIIQKTADLGANFIIAHEPTFYNHLDQTDWLEQDTNYKYKRDLLNKYGIAVWRFHDYWHSHKPDGVQMGVLTTLGWEKYADEKDLHIVSLPSKTSLKQIATHVKAKLGIQMVRAIGDPAQEIQRVAVFPGAAGGRRQIGWLQQIKPDLCICGELSEWETGEYIRDARYIDKKSSLIVLGHAVSEEPGMQWLVPWLQPKVSGIRVTHIATPNPFTFM